MFFFPFRTRETRIRLPVITETRNIYVSKAHGPPVIKVGDILYDVTEAPVYSLYYLWFFSRYSCQTSQKVPAISGFTSATGK